MQETELYFIAIIPPDPVYSVAQAEKEYFAYHFHSKAALRSPPHITLHMPFRLKPKKEAALISSLKKLATKHQHFRLHFNGFKSFEPRVIYIAMDKPDGLINLQKEVGQMMKLKMNVFNVNYKDQVFNPHLTVAFRDLKKAMFYQAWERYREKPYEASVEITAFSLLKHNGKLWEVKDTFPMEGDKKE